MSATRGLEIVTEAVKVFAGALKYQWRSCESSRDHKSASRGYKIGSKGRERACIAHESATRGLEIVAETVRVFAGPFNYYGGRSEIVCADQIKLLCFVPEFLGQNGNDVLLPDFFKNKFKTFCFDL